MRLFKHVAKAQPTTYTIKNISMVELGYIQLALLMAGQPELRTEEDWKPAPVQPKKPSKHGKHEFNASRWEGTRVTRFRKSETGKTKTTAILAMSSTGKMPERQGGRGSLGAARSPRLSPVLTRSLTS